MILWTSEKTKQKQTNNNKTNNNNNYNNNNNNNKTTTTIFPAKDYGIHYENMLIYFLTP